VPIDFSQLPPLSSLVISARFLPSPSNHVPYLLFEEPPPRKLDLTAQIEETCGIDCVRRHYIGKNDSLTITLVRFSDPLDANDMLAYTWSHTIPNRDVYNTYDEYTGTGDDLWAANDGPTLAFARTQGPMFMLLVERMAIGPGAMDFDAPWYMGQLSCLGTLQLSLLSEAASGDTPDHIDEPAECMIWA
jgi:hypothetical protein